ncbi:hypothetical protein BG261_05235 [Floricoccus tropicus]|uniref:N-acetyltransferase domain-containing protein n=1 Tax=Floricoccus tropicus TaxID=1859473 RepID=A0A1E8GMD4_9LACT|nr:GNAT family N-acetyltransferase [Floricoccus tropicus]OFI48793.1 hypothetical protein BG261_05235 [Floricoccus tropicus]
MIVRFQIMLLFTHLKSYFPIEDDVKFLSKDDILNFKGNNDFKECFCFAEEYPDLLGAAILSNNKVVAMAGINQSGKYTLEIGISVLLEYQGKGYATKLVKSITAKAHLEFPEMLQ